MQFVGVPGIYRTNDYLMVAMELSLNKKFSINRVRMWSHKTGSNLVTSEI